MPLYVLRINLEHLSFRLPALLSISQLFNFPIKFISQDPFRGLLVIELEKEDDCRRILERDILVLSAAELYADGKSYDELHAQLKEKLSVFDQYRQSSFKVTMGAAHHSIPERRQRETINSFRYTGLEGPVDLKSPEVEFVIFEDYDFEAVHTAAARFERDGKFVHAYFGRKIGDGQARAVVGIHSVKTRAYYGNTSMDAQMGFLMAGQTLPAPGKIMYDPFVGTGSMLYAVAHWGSYVIGSDIDGRQIRGKIKGKGTKHGILRSAEQYGIEDKIIDCLNFDVTRGPIRRGGWIDAIITDPPYGVRAGAKRLGRAGKKPLREEPYLMPNGNYSHLEPGYLPPSRPYELANLTLDLILLARYLLVPRGRLVFFLPTVTEDYDEVDVPIVEGMRELKVGDGSVQDFGKWGRRLITMEKTALDDGPPPTFEDHDEFNLSKAEVDMPGHYAFNKRYATGFKSRDKMDASPASLSGTASPIPRSSAETPPGESS